MGKMILGHDEVCTLLSQATGKDVKHDVKTKEYYVEQPLTLLKKSWNPFK